jgi:iron complex outermembrane receptor protein
MPTTDAGGGRASLEDAMMRRRSGPTRGCTRLACLVLLAGLATEGAAQTPTLELKRMSLEELMALEVSTVTRAPEPSSLVPAAVFVITADDIRRSGATSLPEILRLAPGVQVARIDAARYAIGMRGFADRLARSMLVLMDGRAVYTPLFAGTYWEVQDTLLADIERIEVIRGPGGTLWGANAVNGIINIVTKRARDTQGAYVTAAAGSELRGPISVRYGGAAGDNFHYRAYAKAVDREAQFHRDGADWDAWHMTQGGFRGDWSLGRTRTLTLQGDVYAGELGQRVSLPSYSPPFNQTSTRDASLSGANALARWSGPIGTGEAQLQAYYDRTHRDERPVAETRDTVDVDFQHRSPVGTRQTLAWGLGYRVSSGRISSVAPTAFAPPDRTDSLYTGFLQDEVALVPDRLRLSFGTKIEHNPYSGFEVQPGARLVWSPNSANTLIWSVTRAMRTPSRVETDYSTTSLVSPAVPSFVRLQPNPDFSAEQLVAYEMGYRVRPFERLYVTASGFFNALDDILSTELLPAFAETTPPPERLILPVTFANGLHGNTHGIELAADVRPTAWWRWTANYSFLRVQMTRDPGSADVSQERRYEGLGPRHQLQLQSSLDVPGGVSVDWLLRYASALPAGPVPAYATSNVRVSWQATPQLEIAVSGRDLHDPQHLEWPGSAGANVQVQRSVQLAFTWRP